MQVKHNKQEEFLLLKLVKKIAWPSKQRIMLLSLLGVPFLLSLVFLFVRSYESEKESIPKETRENGEKKEESEERYGGFELFDSHTWIKGEKELQVLEMRALKGQIEKDLTTFDQIKRANVMIDQPPQKMLGGAIHKPRASVILTLEEGAEISSSLLYAIICHITGAVRGLEPHMVAISDTTGRLFQGIEQENKISYDLFPCHEEERVKENLNQLLCKVVGASRFHLNVSQAEGKKRVGVLLARGIMDEKEIAALEKQIHALGSDLVVAIDQIHFADDLVKRRAAHSIWPYSMIAFFLLSLSSFFFFNRNKSKPSGVDIEKLADLIKDQDPKIIALMFTYLEEAKAEKLLFALPYGVQKKVALHVRNDDKK